jgi:hypothetical protein
LSLCSWIRDLASSLWRISLSFIPATGTDSMCKVCFHNVLQSCPEEKFWSGSNPD